jgi:hypothetical protein
MAETMDPQRVKRITNAIPEQFCKVNKEQNIRRMYLREIQEHIDATDETLTEISKNPLPEELRHFENELLQERKILTNWVDVLKKEVEYNDETVVKEAE